MQDFLRALLRDWIAAVSGAVSVVFWVLKHCWPQWNIPFTSVAYSGLILVAYRFWMDSKALPSLRIESEKNNPAFVIAIGAEKYFALRVTNDSSSRKIKNVRLLIKNVEPDGWEFRGDVDVANLYGTPLHPYRGGCDSFDLSARESMAVPVLRFRTGPHNEMGIGRDSSGNSVATLVDAAFVTFLASGEDATFAELTLDVRIQPDGNPGIKILKRSIFTTAMRRILK